MEAKLKEHNLTKTGKVMSGESAKTATANVNENVRRRDNWQVNQVKSPSDTTIYAPAVKKAVKANKTVPTIVIANQNENGKEKGKEE